VRNDLGRLGPWSCPKHPVPRSIRLCRWQGCHPPASTPGLRRRRKRPLCLSLRRPVLPTLLKNVNTVDFSNHSGARQKMTGMSFCPRCLTFLLFQISGYNRMGGTKATAEELERMFSVMEQNGLLRPTRILTGRPIRQRSIARSG
jgi:hypothetical protein